MFERLHSLLEATLTLYPAAADDTPVTASPVWFGTCANDLRLAERMIVRQTMPGAAPFPRNHPLVATHEINIGRVWTSREPSLDDYTPATSRYVLDILWEAEDFDGWRRRTYYGVTAKSYDLASQERIQMNSEQAFDAEYYSQSSGTGAAPALTSTLPYTVIWVSTAEPPLVLYDYTASTDAFVERLAGQAATRATVLITPTLDALTVNFTGGTGNALVLANTQTTTVGGVIEGVPTTANLPRLDFMYGPTRVASVDKLNNLLVETLVEANATAGSARFELFGNNLLSATLEPTAGTFKALAEV